MIEEGQVLLDLIEHYAYSWRLLFEYDEERPVRGHLRVIVKRILRKHGYPPDKREKATQTVLQQAEVLSQEMNDLVTGHGNSEHPLVAGVPVGSSAAPPPIEPGGGTSRSGATCRRGPGAPLVPTPGA